MPDGFTRLPRPIKRFEVMTDCEMLGVYSNLLLLARFREAYIDGVTVGVNQILISKPDLAKELKFSVSKVKRVLRAFEEIGGIRCENIRNKYTLITILEPFLRCSWDNKGEKGNSSDIYLTDKENDISVFNSGYEEEISDDLSATYRIGDEKKSKPTGRDRGELLPFGKFQNVFLSQKEYDDLIKFCHSAQTLIERYSAQLIVDPGKNADDHFALLYRNCTYESANNDHCASEREKEIRAYSFEESRKERAKELEEFQKKLEHNPVPKYKKRVH